MCVLERWWVGGQVVCSGGLIVSNGFMKKNLVDSQVVKKGM